MHPVCWEPLVQFLVSPTCDHELPRPATKVSVSPECPALCLVELNKRLQGTACTHYASLQGFPVRFAPHHQVQRVCRWVPSLSLQMGSEYFRCPCPRVLFPKDGTSFLPAWSAFQDCRDSRSLATWNIQVKKQVCGLIGQSNKNMWAATISKTLRRFTGLAALINQHSIAFCI